MSDIIKIPADFTKQAFTDVSLLERESLEQSIFILPQCLLQYMDMKWTNFPFLVLELKSNHSFNYSKGNESDLTFHFFPPNHPAETKWIY